MGDSSAEFTITELGAVSQALTKETLLTGVSKARLLMVQYAGDYRETVQRFAEGGGETYYAQKYSVDAVAEMGKQIEEAAVLCCMTTEPYNQIVQNGVRAIGAGFNRKIKTKTLIKLIEAQNPTHLVIRTPIPEVLQWAIHNKVHTIATFAESIPNVTLGRKIRNYRLAILLNHKQIEWIGSYGINASISLQNIGVKTDKIIPWDFPSTEEPSSFSPKKLSVDVKNWNLFYIGALIEAKGVGDILKAVVDLKAKNLPVRLKIAGQDKENFYHTKVRELGIEDCVEFLGLVPNNTVLPLMREADVVLVPSRHEYPEGFPLAITHALCSRTPIIASDHPMFRNNLKKGVNAMLFSAGNSYALSECIERLLSDPKLYHSLSLASEKAWKRLQMPVKWADLIKRWLDNSKKNQQWLFDHRFSSGLYDDCIHND